MSVSWLKLKNRIVLCTENADKLDPKVTESYNRRVFFNQEKYFNALADYNTVMKLEPKEASYYHSRGNLYISIDKTREALADFNTAIKLAPKEASYYHTRGIILQDLGRTREANADFAKAKALQK